jgi:hypothetical protein
VLTSEKQRKTGGTEEDTGGLAEEKTGEGQ